MDTVDPGTYRRAQGVFDNVLAAVPDGQWDLPSACEGWSVADVVGHVIWGQELVGHLAAGRAYASREGAPGAQSPGLIARADPLGTWRAARDTAAAALTESATGRAAPPRFRAEHPGTTLGQFLNVLMIELLAHAWDVGRPLGIEVRPDPDLVAVSRAAAGEIVTRVPGMFAPALEPSPDADEQTRLLAFLGRTA